MATSATLGPLVVGYDGSDSANAAAAFGLPLAGKAGSRTTLVHAGPPPDAGARTAVVVAYERDWRRRLENLREYAPLGAQLDCRVVRGSAAGALIAAALETDAGLILVGSHGAGHVRRALLGSVSAQVIAHAPCSVMVFREHGGTEPATHARTIVVGIDGSPSARAALERAEALAQPLAARLLLVHAYDPHIPFAVMTTEGMRKQLERHGRALLDEARAALAGPAETQLVEGHARDELIAACERHAPALLVVGSRGRGGFRELLVGSTTRGVAHHAPCPVLIARPPLPPSQGAGNYG
jgi:nucleotide-binding universal stress UspA family protein